VQETSVCQGAIVVNRVAIIARLKDGAEQQAADLLAEGPPFNPQERGLESHAAYLSAGEVMFVFDGPEVDVILDEMVENPFEPGLISAFDAWRPLIDGNPRIARLAYEWKA
jgi:hypothetical protein